MTRFQPNASAPPRRVKRRHYDRAFKRHLVDLTLVPGASVARIALDHRINANILFRWRRQYLRELAVRGAKPAAELLPATVADPRAMDILLGSASEARLRGRQQRSLERSGLIEIELPSAQVRVS